MLSIMGSPLLLRLLQAGPHVSPGGKVFAAPIPLRRAARREAAERTLCNSLTLALACGVLIIGVLLAQGRFFLAGMGTTPELLQPAWEYLSIRCCWMSHRRGTAFIGLGFRV